MRVLKFLQKLCQKYNIPTAKFGIFENKFGKKFLNNTKYPNIIKADNLAQAKEFIFAIMNKVSWQSRKYLMENLEKLKMSL